MDYFTYINNYALYYVLLGFAVPLILGFFLFSKKSWNNMSRLLLGYYFIIFALLNLILIFILFLIGSYLIIFLLVGLIIAMITGINILRMNILTDNERMKYGFIFFAFIIFHIIITVLISLNTFST
jgi:hypothetical protein